MGESIHPSVSGTKGLHAFLISIVVYCRDQRGIYRSRKH